MPLLRTAVILGLTGSLVAPALAVAANYRPQPTKACLGRAHVVSTVGKPDRGLTRFGVTATASFNFVLANRTPTPQGLILFTRSAAAAKRARADLVRWIRRQAGTGAFLPLVLERNALVAWVSLPESTRQANLVAGCLRPA